jgi:hypothetical protein
LVTLGSQLLRKAGASHWPTTILIEKGYLFRTSHEFSFELTSRASATSLVFLGVLALVGLTLAWQLGTHKNLPATIGLFIGHVILGAAAVIAHGPWTPESWKLASTLPYMLHLTRTTPVLVLLAALLAVAGLDAMFRSSIVGTPDVRILRLLFLAALVCFSAVFVSWSLWLIACLVVVPLLHRMLSGRSIPRLATPATAMTAAVACLAALPILSFPADLEVQQSTQERELYEWARTSTSEDTLFIIPPGFQEFRTLTLRGAFVDFKLYPASTPSLIHEWRRRMELVSAPDRLALELSGWGAMAHWDRTYAQNNTSNRIAWLLRETGADFFVRDQAGLEQPPYLDVPESVGSQLESVFENSRFSVLQLRRAQ